MMFRGDYGFLSNMYAAPITLGSVTYTCAEAAFQAAKLSDKSQRKMFAGISGAEAKKLGRKIELRPDWETIKVPVMKWIVAEKFRQNPQLKIQLTIMCQGEIEETNLWGDTFWGVCKGVGENNLGKILMEVRDELLAEDAKKITIVEIPRHADTSAVVSTIVPSAKKPERCIELRLRKTGADERQEQLGLLSKISAPEAHLELNGTENSVNVVAYGKAVGTIFMTVKTEFQKYENKKGVLRITGGLNGYYYGGYICF